MLAGLRSRWTMPLSWTVSSAAATWQAMRMHVGIRQRAGHEAIRQGLARNELHDDEGRSIGLAELVDAGNVGVAKRGQHAGFAAEPFERCASRRCG